MHEKKPTFSDKETMRGLDTIEYLLIAVGAAESQEVALLKSAIGQKPPVRPSTSVRPPVRLKPPTAVSPLEKRSTEVGAPWRVQRKKEMCVEYMSITCSVYERVGREGAVLKSDLKDREQKIAYRLALLGYLECDDFSKTAEDLLYTMALHKPEGNELDL